LPVIAPRRLALCLLFTASALAPSAITHADEEEVASMPIVEGSLKLGKIGSKHRTDIRQVVKIKFTVVTSRAALLNQRSPSSFNRVKSGTLLFTISEFV
jgi:hypothetical protein